MKLLIQFHGKKIELGRKIGGKNETFYVLSSLFTNLMIVSNAAVVVANNKKTTATKSISRTTTTASTAEQDMLIFLLHQTYVLLHAHKHTQKKQCGEKRVT